MLPFTHDTDIDQSHAVPQRFEAPEVIDLDPDDPMLLCDGTGETDVVDDDDDAYESERSTLPYRAVLGYEGTD
jgi:hypothetical protein